MDSLKKYTTPIIAIVIIVLLFVAYKVFFKADDNVADDTIVAAVTEGDEVRSEVIKELNRLESLDKIDGALLANPLFASLKDMTPPLIQEAVGKSNPFSSIGAGIDARSAPAKKTNVPPSR